MLLTILAGGGAPGGRDDPAQRGPPARDAARHHGRPRHERRPRRGGQVLRLVQGCPLPPAGPVEAWPAMPSSVTTRLALFSFTPQFRVNPSSLNAHGWPGDFF